MTEDSAETPGEATPAPLVDSTVTATASRPAKHDQDTGFPGVEPEPGVFFCPQRGLNAGASARLARQTASLLQRRLVALGWVILLVMAASLARFYFIMPAGIPGTAVGLVIAALCLGVLRGERLSPRTLRGLEVVLFGGLLASLAITQYAILGGALQQSYLGFFRQMVNRVPGLYVLAMVTHGMLVPNRWKRTAVFSGIAAVVPVALGMVVYQQHGTLIDRLPRSELIETQSFALLLLATGAFIASYGARIIHEYRRELAEMDDAGMYVLEKKLGSGGMGDVWCAQHRMLRRPVAIKMMRPELLTGGKDVKHDVLRERFRREARATASLQSPHSVQLYDFGITQDGIFFYVMEYLEGLDLATLVKRYGPLPPERVIYLLRQAAESLREAHERGVVHRDVKPGNIHVGQLAGTWDWVKVLDFGLVKMAGEPDQTTITGEGITTGTPAFFPPEMTGGASAADERSDIYALAAVAYWLVTGQLMFPDRTPLEMMVAHAKEDPVPPSKRVELQIPAELDAIIMRGLAKDPGDRPQDMRELIEALDAVPVDERWSAERAGEWWRLHRPELVEAAVSAGPATGPSFS